jgi:hypothetical protein
VSINTEQSRSVRFIWQYGTHEECVLLRGHAPRRCNRATVNKYSFNADANRSIIDDTGAI